MNTWLALFNALSGLISALSKAADRYAEKEALSGAEKSGRRDILIEVMNDAGRLIEQAEFVRRVFRDDMRLHPERLHDDDGYKRPEPATQSVIKRTEHHASGGHQAQDE